MSEMASPPAPASPDLGEGSRRLRRAALPALTCALLSALAHPVEAHEVRPGYLGIRETAPERYRVLWKVPMRGQLRLHLDPVFPPSCTLTAPKSADRVAGAMVERFTLSCEGGLVGRPISISGLASTLTDVLVRFEPLDAPSQTVRLRPAAPSFAPAEAPGRIEIAGTYLVLGVEHILGGVDHLLFVLALLMIVRGARLLLLWTVTAFTVSHSITLALATLGLVHLPSAPVEAVIALSILFLAAEIVHAREGRPGLTARYPWIVAFTFGLLHGFGFAGALAEVGLPEEAIPLALLLFNLGVEAGQLLFVAAVLSVAAIGRQLARRRPALAPPRWAWRVPTYAIGSIAAFWTVQRIASFWS